MDTKKLGLVSVEPKPTGRKDSWTGKPDTEDAIEILDRLLKESGLASPEGYHPVRFGRLSNDVVYRAIGSHRLAAVQLSIGDGSAYTFRRVMAKDGQLNMDKVAAIAKELGEEEACRKLAKLAQLAKHGRDEGRLRALAQEIGLRSNDSLDYTRPDSDTYKLTLYVLTADQVRRIYQARKEVR